MADFEIIPEPAKKPDNKLKIITIVLGVLVVILGGALLYLSLKKIPDLQQEKVVVTSAKDSLMNNLLTLRIQYDDLQTNNDTLNEQLNIEKQKVDMMIEKLKKTEASNRTKIREYERELGTLRDIMRSYIVQIDSLNTLNIQLVEETRTARAEAQVSQQKYQTLIQTTDDLAQKVEKGSVLKARDIAVLPINAKGKDVTRASRTEKLRTCFILIENSIAERGLRNVFIRVKGPDGILMTQSENNVFQSEEGQLIYSAVREIDYQGDDVEMCIFYGGNIENEFIKGTYTVDLYSGGALIGSGQLLLK